MKIVLFIILLFTFGCGKSVDTLTKGMVDNIASSTNVNLNAFNTQTGWVPVKIVVPESNNPTEETKVYFENIPLFISTKTKEEITTTIKQLNAGDNFKEIKGSYIQEEGHSPNLKQLDHAVIIEEIR